MSPNQPLYKMMRMGVYVKLTLLALVMLFFIGVISAATAHHAPKGWEYDYDCCHDKDCAPVQAQHDELGDYAIDSNGMKWYFRDAQSIRPSQDSDYHICVYAGKLRCAYIPSGT